MHDDDGDDDDDDDDDVYNKSDNINLAQRGFLAAEKKVRSSPREFGSLVHYTR